MKYTVATIMAKLSSIEKALTAVLTENVSRNRSIGEVRVRSNYEPSLVKHYFDQAAMLVKFLRDLLPDLYADFQALDVEPNVKMATGPNDPKPNFYGRPQLERLCRDIDQIFDIRANSELAQPAAALAAAPRRVFITHGRAHDWRAVQAHIEKDVGLNTIELAQQPNVGQTIVEKLEFGADQCDSAVIVMTGDDTANGDEARVRENVMHEIGYFHGKYGRSRVILLHEEGVNIPSNLSGIAYVPFPKGSIETGFHTITRELKAVYKTI
jgi:predicted nucleotide-binding protein